MLKEFVSRFRRPKEKVELEFGPVSVLVDAETLEKINLMHPVQNTKLNLEEAERVDIKPLSLGEIVDQIDPSDLNNIVLFDTAPDHAIGNHWRITGMNREKKTATLQYCGVFGNYDNTIIPPLKIPLDAPLFTGISIQQFEIEGLPVSLGEVVRIKHEERMQKIEGRLFSDSNESHKETILWSNPEGELVESSEHPSLKAK